MRDLLSFSENISTPAVIFNYNQGIKNIIKMQKFADEYGLLLRPHIKAHKMPIIALEQLKYGAQGITASKLGEVEVMLDAGIKDIILAYPVVGKLKIKKFISLAKRAKLSTIVDNTYVADKLNEAALDNDMVVEVYIKIDTGLNRLGVTPGADLLQLAKYIKGLKALKLKGILTHAGHVYGATNRAKVEQIALSEGTQMVACKDMLHKANIDVEIVSIGSTPTVKLGGTVKGVTEIRPGNYVLNDAIQVGLGAATIDECSLRVITTVISKPTKNRVVIDAGSKVFALDKGAHGNNIVNGFGIILNHPKATLTRLSEEHGEIECSEDSNINIGDRLEIVPNHACTVINLTEEVYFWYGQDKFKPVKVTARGKVQ